MRLALILLVSFWFTLPAHALHVLIDPGHGGVDKGAVKGKLKEAEIALKVALKLADLMKDDVRFTSTMTRDSDRTLSLDRRTQISKDTKPDLFLSIHLNSSTDPRAHGKEFYFQNQIPADEEALFLASKENAELESSRAEKESSNKNQMSDVKLIVEDLKRNYRVRASAELSKILFKSWENSGRATNLGSRSIRQAPFHVVSQVTVPSVLVELGFLTNAQEGPLLATDDYQNALAKSLFEGLVKYKETMDKNPSHF
ncbi:MAG: N-acetylmuramoyl-L-alanine amidase [Bdellovibrionota bacterium]